MSHEDLEDWITTKLAEGIEATAEDFRGWDCGWCGDPIPFEAVLRDRDAVEVWDIQVMDPEDEEPPGHHHRYYFCSADCRTHAQRYPNAVEQQPDVVEDAGVPIIAEEGDSR